MSLTQWGLLLTNRPTVIAVVAFFSPVLSPAFFFCLAVSHLVKLTQRKMKEKETKAITVYFNMLHRVKRCHKEWDYLISSHLPFCINFELGSGLSVCSRQQSKVVEIFCWIGLTGSLLDQTTCSLLRFCSHLWFDMISPNSHFTLDVDNYIHMYFIC